MSDYMTLLGADDVRSAGRAMQAAASEMQQAASNIEGALAVHQRFLEDWLAKFREALDESTATRR